MKLNFYKEMNLKCKAKVFFIGTLATLLFAEASLRTIGFISKQYYDTQAFAKETNDSDYTVMTVGNSYTAGLGAPPGESYSDFLQKKLNERQDRSYKVINAGRINANTTIILERLPDLLKKHHPQMVFLRVGEPNLWNRYGYYRFLSDQFKSRNNLTKSIKNEYWLDLLRYTSLFRTYESLQFEIEKNKKQNAKYSVFFKSIPINQENRLMLAYSWVAALGSESVIKVRDLSELEFQEARDSLLYLMKEKNNPSSAALYLAKIHMDYKKSPMEALEYFSKAIENSTLFDWEQFVFFENNKNLFKKINFDVASELDNIIKERWPKENFDKVRAFLTDYFNHDHGRYDKETIYQASLYFQSQGDLIQSFASSKNYRPGSEDTIKLFNMIERVSRQNPLTFKEDLLTRAREAARQVPTLRPRYELFKSAMMKKLNLENLDKITHSSNNLEKWIIHDLEKIITLIKDSGAQVIVQTYPPLRHGEIRFADTLLRK